MDFLVIAFVLSPLVIYFWWNGKRKNKGKNESHSQAVVQTEKRPTPKPRKSQDTSKWTPADFKWRELQEQSLKHARDGQIGLYRNTLLDKAEFLEKEGKRRDAFKMYARILYLDIGDSDGGMVAPVIWDRFVRYGKEFAGSDVKLADAFVAAAKPEKSTVAPLTPEEAWKAIQIKLQKL